jgi:hypothetical protein
MDILPNKLSSTENRPGSSPFVLQKTLEIFKWLIEFFDITDEELSESGIMMGNDNREGSS